MRRIIGRPAVIIAGLAVVLASCGGDAPALTTTTTTTAGSPATTSSTPPTTPVTISTSTSTTTTTLPSGPPLVVEGDTNETVEAFQFLLNCNGHGDLTVDGVFGPATLAAVKAAQTSLGQAVDGAPDDLTMAELSRSCGERRRLEGEGEFTVVGNAAPDDPEVFSVALLSGSTVTIGVTLGTDLTVALTGNDASDVTAVSETTWEIDAAGDHLIEIGSPSGPMTFSLAIEIVAGVQEVGDWVIATNGIAYRGTKLTLGDDAQTVIDQVFDFLGHGVRGTYEEFDTGWYPITTPQDLGLRGVFIEGLAFLFWGPDPSNLDRPETFRRIRYVGSGVDGSGDARPENYVTTAEGITVGHTLTDLKAAYGTRVKPGSSSDEHYYRLSDSGGELCFYFGADQPTDFSEIIEIASECRN